MRNTMLSFCTVVFILWYLCSFSFAPLPSHRAQSVEAHPVILVVIDTGIDLANDSLAPFLWVNEAEIEDGIDNDNNGYIDDRYGYDVARGRGSAVDIDGHGTMVSGVVTSVNSGVPLPERLSDKVKILPVSIFPHTQIGSVSGADAIYYAIRVKKDTRRPMIINLSWVNSAGNEDIERAIKAAEQENILIVAAAGNDGGQPVRYPAAYDLPNIISVSATDGDALADFANLGAQIGAPGKRIITTAPGNIWTTADGTSLASPIVALVGALILADNPSLSYTEVRGDILDTADDLNELRGKVKKGRKLNAPKALALR